MNEIDDMVQKAMRGEQLGAPRIPLRSSRIENAVLVVASCLVKRHDIHGFETLITHSTHVRGLESNWVGQFAVVTGVLSGQRMVTPPGFATGAYRITDFNKMLADDNIKITMIAGEKLTVFMRFDWPDKSWIREPQEFRCWWRAEVSI